MIFCGSAYVRFWIIAHCPYQNKPILKTPHLMQRSSIYFLPKPSSHYFPNFVAMATRVAREKNRVASFDGLSPKTPYRCKHFADISYIRRVITNFVPNFVAMTTRVVRGKFGWQHSMAHPRKLHYRRKNLADISYTDRVIVNFVPKFVTMATEVGRGKI